MDAIEKAKADYQQALKLLEKKNPEIARAFRAIDPVGKGNDHRRDQTDQCIAVPVNQRVADRR